MLELIFVPRFWSSTCCNLKYKIKQVLHPLCGYQRSNHTHVQQQNPQGLRDNYSETEEETKQGQERDTNSLVCLGWLKSSHLAFLSKVFCEFFQFFQVFFVDRWLRVCQRPQHVRLEKENKKMLPQYNIFVCRVTIGPYPYHAHYRL